MSHAENPYTIEPTIDVGYQITPFAKKIVKESETGVIWQLEPGNSTKVQLITDPEYRVQTEAVFGDGYFLRVLPGSPESYLDFHLASPRLKGENPVIVSGRDIVVCWIACQDSKKTFAVEGIDINRKFSPMFEEEIYPLREKIRITRQEDIILHLEEFWKAREILTSQPLAVAVEIYPQLQSPYELLQGT